MCPIPPLAPLTSTLSPFFNPAFSATTNAVQPATPGPAASSKEASSGFLTTVVTSIATYSASAPAPALRCGPTVTYPKARAPGYKFPAGATPEPVVTMWPKKSSSGIAGLRWNMKEQRCIIIDPPGLSTACVTRTRTWLGNESIGRGNDRESVRTEGGGPARM
ncbi:hypothetical protein AOQ84DRAFT_417276 [Glonium stellatum]|uniref:Uncharacterized protein n=1 Tax=Glonium stellatum TaxID=574774 RepID=A0A8E2FDE0_9PEZI|nr:hypothetical protein AOQ84DRAFT_417276 [Glonium stellatum]